MEYKVIMGFGGILLNSTTSVSDIKELPFIVASNGLIVEASQAFVDMTEFSVEDFLNKNIEHLFSILRIGPNVSYEDIDGLVDYFLFTKSLEVRFVNICIIEDMKERIFIFSENPNSRINDKFPTVKALSSHNMLGIAVFSTPYITLLEANKVWLNFLDKPFNIRKNSIGRKISEIISTWRGSTSEDIWRNLLLTQKPFYSDEYMYEFKRGVTYWQASLTPVFENGTLKYCIEITTDITEKVLNRKKIEEQAKIIEEQNEYLRMQSNLLNLSYEAIFAWDLNVGIIYWNKGAEQQYGYSSEEVIGCISHDLLKTVHSEPLDNIKSILLREGVWSGELEHSRKDGSKLIVETRHQLIVDEHGRQIVLETNRDITERKKINEELKQQKDLLEETIENMNDAVIIYDTRRNSVLMNSEAYKMYPNVDKDTLVEEFYDGVEFYDMDNKAIPIEKLPRNRVIKGGRIRNEKMVIKGSNKDMIVEVNASPAYDKKNNLTSAVVIYHDISKVAEYEKELIAQKQMDEIIIENTYENLFVLDSIGNYLISRNNIIKEIPTDFKNIKDLYGLLKYYDLDGNIITLDRMPQYRVLHREVVRNEIIHLKGDVFEYYIIINGMPIYDENGNFLYGVITSRNITEFMQSQYALKETQEKLLIVEREKNEALEKSLEMKDEFLSLISHELRTPLNVINTAVQAMQLICKDELSDKAKGYIKMIRQNMFRQLRLVNNLLDITRTDAGSVKIHKKNIDIVFLTNSIVKSVSTFASQKGVNIEFITSLTKKIIGIDEEKYERILLNILSNAIKFTPEGKSVTVKMRSMKKVLCIEVIDTGIGIPEDKIGIIFERFGQIDSLLSRQAEGAGIGLSLVKRFVEALDGSISVKSKFGKGSNFTIILPDYKVLEEIDLDIATDLMDDRLIQITTVEFSDIYL